MTKSELRLLITVQKVHHPLNFIPNKDHTVYCTERYSLKITSHTKYLEQHKSYGDVYSNAK